MQEPRPRRSTMKVLGKTVGSEGRWSVRPEHGVPEKIVLKVWGVMFDAREQAIDAYKKAGGEI